MSQYKSQLKNKRQVIYGLDMPTGGYFVTVFYRKDEIKDEDHDTAFSRDALTLTELNKWLKDFEVPHDLCILATDYFMSEPPTPLQLNVSSMFGKDIHELLMTCKNDLEENWVEYIF
jgi:hypothetical protein